MTRVVNISDVEFAFAQTAEEGNTIDGSMLYDATTGERVGETHKKKGDDKI